MSDVASASAAGWPRRPAQPGMAVEPTAAFGFAALVSTLPAGSFMAHFRQGTAVPGNLLGEFPRARRRGACTAEREGGDSLLLSQ